jgi:hypothetical protein
MGLDLALLPFDGDDYSHTILNCGRNDELFDFIQTLPALEVPTTFTSFLSYDDYEETHYGTTIETPYGEPLTYTTVKKLLTVSENIKETFGIKNKAVWAYLEQFDKNTKVALFWT